MEDHGVDGVIVLNWVCKEVGWEVVGWKSVRQVAGCCEYDNEHKVKGNL